MLNNVFDEVLALIESTGKFQNLSFSNIPWRKVGRYFSLFGSKYYNGSHLFVLLGEQTKSEFRQ